MTEEELQLTAAKEKVRAWLLDYAWVDDTPEEKAAEVECILAQGDWQHISAMADKYAEAQNEPGPAAFAEGEEYALSSLYECHDGPHADTCPRYTKNTRFGTWTKTGEGWVQS
jgi:hypothetical protein